MKYRTYFLTFLNYTAQHCLRTCYSFIKPDFRKVFEVSNSYLANVDAATYVGHGIGLAFLFVLTNTKQMMNFYLSYSVLAALLYLVLPISAMFGIGHYIDEDGNTEYSTQIITIIFIAETLFGFFQLCIWPTIFLLLNSYFNNQKEGLWLGLWAGAGNVGNILGYLIPSLLTINLGFSWPIPMFFFVFFFIAIVVLIYFSLRPKTFQQKQQEKKMGIQGGLQDEDEDQDIYCSQFIVFIIKMIKIIDFRYFIGSLCLFKAINYGFLLWLPTYVDQMGFKQISAYAGILFSIGTIIGSTLMGKLYEGNSEDSKESYFPFKKYVLSLLGLLSILSLILISYVTVSIEIFILLIIIAGFAIGGIYNCLMCNETIRITQRKSSALKLMSMLTLSSANIVTGFTEFIIGLLVGDNQSDSKNVYGTVFIVLLGVAVMGTILLFFRALLAKDESKIPVNNEEPED